MRNTALILLLAASTAAAIAQTHAKPATAPAKSASAVKPAVKPATTSVKAASSADKLPTGMTAIAGPKKTLYAITLRYQDEKVGEGAEALPGKMLKYNFALWTDGANGMKLDSTDEHRMPVLDKDKKPVMDENGKPKLGDPQPATMIMGQGRPLPGWDQGLVGMKAGGKRRIFIPWQLGLGDREVPQRDATHPAIPARSDLILDVDLAEVLDAPAPPQHPGMMPGGMHPPMGGPNGAPMGAHPMPGAAGAPPAPAMAMPPAAAPAAAPTPGPAVAPAAAPATPTQPQSK